MSPQELHRITAPRRDRKVKEVEDQSGTRALRQTPVDPCRIKRCRNKKSSAGERLGLCKQHHQAYLRNGHPLQTAVVSHELRFYRKRIRRFLDSPSGEMLRGKLKQAASRFTEVVRKLIEDSVTRTESKRTARIEALRAVQELASVVTAEEFGIEVVALLLRNHDSPRRLRSEEAVHVQAARGLFRLGAQTSRQLPSWEMGRNYYRRRERKFPSRAMRSIGESIVRCYQPLATAVIQLCIAERGRRGRRFFERVLSNQ